MHMPTCELPVHRRHVLRILNPTVPIDVALEDCRESESGYGPQRLSTLAAYSLRLGLLAWLQDAQVATLSSAVIRPHFNPYSDTNLQTTYANVIPLQSLLADSDLPCSMGRVLATTKWSKRMPMVACGREKLDPHEEPFFSVHRHTRS
jgi:hypothetical protein